MSLDIIHYMKAEIIKYIDIFIEGKASFTTNDVVEFIYKEFDNLKSKEKLNQIVRTNLSKKNYYNEIKRVTHGRYMNVKNNFYMEPLKIKLNTAFKSNWFYSGRTLEREIGINIQTSKYTEIIAQYSRSNTLFDLIKNLEENENIKTFLIDNRFIDDMWIYSFVELLYNKRYDKREIDMIIYYIKKNRVDFNFFDLLKYRPETNIITKRENKWMIDQKEAIMQENFKENFENIIRRIK